MVPRTSGTHMEIFSCYVCVNLCDENGNLCEQRTSFVHSAVFSNIYLFVVFVLCLIERVSKGLSPPFFFLNHIHSKILTVGYFVVPQFIMCLLLTSVFVWSNLRERKTRINKRSAMC